MDEKRILIDKPLEHLHELVVGPYSSVEYLHPKYSKFLLHSDVSIDIQIKWCVDNSDMSSGVAYKTRCPANMYRSEDIKILMPWFYIVVNRPEGTGVVPCKKLHVEIFNSKKQEQTKQVKTLNERKARALSFEPRLSLEEEEEKRRDSMTSVVVADSVKDTVSRSKSPFNPKSWSREKKRVVSTKGPVNGVDYRLPEIIHKNCLLIGGENGRVTSLPKPHCGGLYLMSDEYGNFEWSLPYPPGKV